MRDDEQTKQYPWSAFVSNLQSKRHTFFHRSRQRLGHTATIGVVELKQFLKREISLPTVDQLLGTTKPVLIDADDTMQKVERLKKIINQSHEVLASAQTALNLFPDSVVVDRTKVTITKRNFFWSSSVISIRIEDVLNVSTSVGPFFGSLNIASRVMNSTDHFQINFFWRNDAVNLKHIIQGYMIAIHNNIDTSHLSKPELIETLIDLGHDSAGK